MKEGGRANALQLELLLVIFFFMIAATTLVELFAAAKLKSMQAKAMNNAMLQLENLADELYGAEDPEAVLTEQGFVLAGEGWSLQEDGYVVKVTRTEETTEAGTLRTFDLDAYQGDTRLITLPSSRYIQKGVAP